MTTLKKKNPYTQEPSALGQTARATPGKGARVVVAMSGGVDSSVAAALLKRQGYEVIGMALQTTDYSKYLSDDSGGSCCSIKDMEDARRVAEKIGIPFYVVDTEKTFDATVVDYFISDYLQGRTPNPCVMCNTQVKFKHLYKKAMDLGADFIATGHYAKVSQEPELGFCLWRGIDDNKDQSYFLFNLSQAQLAKTLFPIGHLQKPEVRKLALEFGLSVAEKPDSQEICFVPGNDYAGFIESRVAASQRPKGYFVTDGNVVLGDHEGIHRYTVGQRKGIGDALDHAKRLGLQGVDEWRVIKIDPIRHRIHLGGPVKALRQALIARDANWIVPIDLDQGQPKKVQARIRHRAALAPAEMFVFPDNSFRLYFDEPQNIITPGQAVVIYDNNLCLGGAWISEAIGHERDFLSRPEAFAF